MMEFGRTSLKITSVQSLAPETGVSLTASKLVKQAKKRGERVLAVDLCTKLSMTSYLNGEGFIWLDDGYTLFDDPSLANWITVKKMPSYACFYDPDPRKYASKPKGEPQYIKYPVTDLVKAGRMLTMSFDLLDPYYDLCVFDVPNRNFALMQLLYSISDNVFVVTQKNAGLASTNAHYRDQIIGATGRKDEPHIAVLSDGIDRNWSSNSSTPKGDIGKVCQC